MSHIQCVQCGRFLSKDEISDAEEMRDDMGEQDDYPIFVCDRCMKQSLQNHSSATKGGKP